MMRRIARSGTVIVAVLVVIVLAGFFTLHVATHISMSYRILRDRRESVQCELLAESGLLRGISQYQNDAKYPGETWDIPAADLPANQSATVQIQVTSDDATLTTQIEVIATYPVNGAHRHVARRVWQSPLHSAP